MTPLHYAAQNGYLSIVQHLLPLCKVKNPRDRSSNTPLSLAMQNNQAKVIDFLKAKKKSQSKKAKKPGSQPKKKTSSALAVKMSSYSF